MNGPAKTVGKKMK